MVYTEDLKSLPRKGLRVRISFPVPIYCAIEKGVSQKFHTLQIAGSNPAGAKENLNVKHKEYL